MFATSVAMMYAPNTAEKAIATPLEKGVSKRVACLMSVHASQESGEVKREANGTVSSKRGGALRSLLECILACFRRVSRSFK